VEALTPRCERAREAVSRAQDGELSELEQRLLAAHVGGCAECAEYARGVAAATAVLRAASPELPGRTVVPPPRRAVGLRLVQVAAVAAAVAAAVGLGSIAGTLTSSSSGPSSATLAKQQTQQPYVEQRLLALLRLGAERAANHGAIAG
jgi:predicted anti-sigma-YlaC factor YlaD